MNRVQARFVKDGLVEQANLNEWERNFLNHLAVHYTDKDLTADQNKKLNQIQKKVSQLTPGKVLVDENKKGGYRDE